MEIQYAITNYRPINGGALKGKFTLVLDPEKEFELELRECTYFSAGNKDWINLPQKESKKSEDSKTQYFPLAQYKNKNFWENLKKQICAQLKDISNGASNAASATRKEDMVQGNAQPVWF